jgi:hypothetical protein
LANYAYNLIQNEVPMVGEPLKANIGVATNGSGQVTYQWQSLAVGQTTWTNIVELCGILGDEVD